jgi:heptosyltransferase-2
MAPPTPRHIVVSRTDKIGDLILSLPVFQTLRRSFPDARITALVSSYAKEIVQDHPDVDAVEAIEPGEGVWALRNRLKALGPDVFIALYPRPGLALAAWLAGIPIRVGTAFRWYSFAFDPTVRIHRSLNDRHEVEFNLAMLKPLGVQEFTASLELPVKKEHQAFAKDLLAEKGIRKGDRYIVVHPGHKGSALNWSPLRYSQLISKVCKETKLKVIITAGPEETALISQLMAFLTFGAGECKPILLIGACTLKQLAAVYQGAECFLSGSTGTMHLAAAVGTPTVSLFCPIPETTPARWGPWGNPSTVLMPENAACVDCRTGYCKKHDPMNDIRVVDVFDAMMKYVDAARKKK